MSQVFSTILCHLSQRFTDFREAVPGRFPAVFNANLSTTHSLLERTEQIFYFMLNSRNTDSQRSPLTPRSSLKVSLYITQDQSGQERLLKAKWKLHCLREGVLKQYGLLSTGWRKGRWISSIVTTDLYQTTMNVSFTPVSLWIYFNTGWMAFSVHLRLEKDICFLKGSQPSASSCQRQLMFCSWRLGSTTHIKVESWSKGVVNQLHFPPSLSSLNCRRYSA